MLGPNNAAADLLLAVFAARAYDDTPKTPSSCVASYSANH
jgi:hypothetical protein